jgi:acetate kinase
MPAAILVLNGGSSSIKAALFEFPDGSRTWEAQRQIPAGAKAEDFIEPILRTLWEGQGAVLSGPRDIGAVGHRIVHGGNRFRDPVRINKEVRRQLAELGDFAPEHNCLELAIIDRTEAVLGTQTAQIAVFDTAFHSTLPERAYVYGGPYEWLETNGIRRYGFHGLSHRYATGRASELLGRPVSEVNLITSHLGNGCSLAAVRGGISVDTTMGFTPLDGLLMGSRSGSVDPAILTHLQRKHGLNPDDLDRILNEESGLKGLSGLSADMREIEAAKERGDVRATLAFDCFVHQLCRGIGAMLASLNALDAIVFTGGIGEHSAAVRQTACDRFRLLGLEIDKHSNARAKPDIDISAPGSTVRVLVIKAQEDWEIAQDVQRTLVSGARL